MNLNDQKSLGEILLPEYAGALSATVRQLTLKEVKSILNGNARHSLSSDDLLSLQKVLKRIKTNQNVAGYAKAPWEMHKEKAWAPGQNLPGARPHEQNYMLW